MPPDFVRPSALSPRHLTRSAILVCERSPRLTPELQRQFHASGVGVRGCRKWAELAELSRGFARTLVVIQLDDGPAECLAGLGQRLRETDPPPVIVLASPRFADLENVLREAGVCEFFTELPTGAHLARACRKWLDWELNS